MGIAIRRVLKWSAIVLGVIVGLALLAAGYVYFASQRIVNRTYDIAGVEVSLPTDSLSLAEGQRLATIRGCFNGCHGEGVNGQVFFDEPGLARLVAPNLTQVAALLTDAELERVIRQGVRRNGRSTLGMPSSMFYQLSDEDLGAILAFIRSVPVSEGPATEIALGPLARLGVVLGKYDPQTVLIEQVAPRPAAVDTSDRLAFGAYLAMTACSECHGPNLRGSPETLTPDLAIAASYSLDDFRRLMQTGKAIGDRELRLMSGVARGRFVHFTEREVRALHAFLSSLTTADGRDAAGAAS